MPSKLVMLTWDGPDGPVDPGYGRPGVGPVDPGYGRPVPPVHVGGGPIYLPVFPYDPTKPVDPDKPPPTPPAAIVWPPTPGARFVIKFLACYGLVAVPDPSPAPK